MPLSTVKSSKKFEGLSCLAYTFSLTRRGTFCGVVIERASSFSYPTVLISEAGYDVSMNAGRK
jgi:hypothetical protein